MSDQELAELEVQERELTKRCDEAEAVYKSIRNEWSDVWNKIRREQERRRYFAEFQAEQATQAAFAGAFSGKGAE